MGGILRCDPSRTGYLHARSATVQLQQFADADDSPSDDRADKQPANDVADHPGHASDNRRARFADRKPDAISVRTSDDLAYRSSKRIAVAQPIAEHFTEWVAIGVAVREYVTDAVGEHKWKSVPQPECDTVGHCVTVRIAQPIAVR